MTYGDVFIAIQGYNDAQMNEWTRARFVGYQSYLSIPERKGAKKKRIDKWFPLPIDEGYNPKEELSHEERIERLKAFAKK